MASTGTATAKRSFLPAGFVTFIRRRLIELGGLLVIAVAIAFAAALFSYDIADPSTDTSIRAQAVMTGNWLGTPGAWIANILFQWIGIAGYVFPLAMLGWGSFSGDLALRALLASQNAEIADGVEDIEIAEHRAEHRIHQREARPVEIPPRAKPRLDLIEPRSQDPDLRRKCCWIRRPVEPCDVVQNG